MAHSSDLGDQTMATVDALQIVRDLEPIILRHAATAEVNRKMAPEVMSALVDTGLLRMWIPQALGVTLSPSVLFQATEVIK
jgi:hypothetical protein